MDLSDFPNWQLLNFHQKQALYLFLSEYLTDHRRDLFSRVIAERSRYITIAVEDIEQERNSGALMRNCDCFGIQDIHIIEKKHEFKVADIISKGAQKWVNDYIYDASEAKNSLDCIQHLRTAGYKIVATTPNRKGESPDTLPLDQPIALFFGTEQDGLSEEVLEAADAYLNIPMHGFTESFNVSVSAALAMYRLTHRLREEKIDWALSPEEQIDLLIEWSCRTIRRADGFVQHFLDQLADYPQ